MFTGIIEETGHIRSFDPHSAGARIVVACRTVVSDATVGSSIAVNGVCLTALDITQESFAADLAPETLKRSNLGDLKPGSAVNLERPLLATGRLSGHVVQGHVDGTGAVVSLDALGDDNWWLRVRIPPELDRYVVYKGSICIDGISLTVAEIRDCIVSITIIPHTYENTALKNRRPGDRVNVECDIIGKYAEKMLAGYAASAR